ncbi:hypothetical protein QTP88_005012 [Uroleucon formosanum]
METAMEPRNATETLASYGQDAGDFGPETDVDTPDEPIGLTKPKVEGEVIVVDESGEESEEDGGGWNYYKKPIEDAEEKTSQEDVNSTSNNSDAEDMDYKLNPDAPEFVPVSSPPASTMNHAQRLLNTENDDFISSSPQKFKDLDNVVVSDENDFTNEIKVHAADLSKLDNHYELNDDSTMLNGIKPLNCEEVTIHGATNDNFIFQNEPITNGNLDDDFQNPFVSDDKVDLNKVQDLSEYQNDDAQTHNTDPFVSVIESSKNNEFNLTSGDNEPQNESDVELNSDFPIVKHEGDMNSPNIDDTINTTNATVGSTLQFDEESFKHDDFKNDFLDSSQIDKFAQYEDSKLNDSESTTDAILGSEPHTPMRMDNQSTFESENDDDQFSEAFKQQTQFNQFDENNDKENHDPFCFEQTEDPAGIIPNVTHEVNNEVDEIHHNIDNIIPKESLNENQVSELLKHEPVEEPLCIKEEAKPFHSVYEQQYLPESDFSASTHEALLNATENESSIHEVDDSKIDNFEPHTVVDSHEEIKDEYLEHLKINEYSEPRVVPIQTVDSHIDDVQCHAEDLEQEFQHDNTYNFEYENNSVNSVQNEGIELKHNYVNDEHKLVEDVKHENHGVDFIQNHVEELEIIKNTEYVENDNVAKVVQEDIEVPKDQFDVSVIQDSDNFEQNQHNNVSDITSYNTEDSKEEDQLIVEDVKKCVENVDKTEPIPIEDFEQKYFNNVSEEQLNQIDNFKQGLHNEEVENSNVECFEQEHESHNIDLFEKNYAQDIKEHQSNLEVENNDVEHFKQEQDIVDEFLEKHNEDLQQENYGNESIQNHTTDSDEEMHSSMIIHSDVENNMPQPYCSASDTINESNMMCTSMTFEENFQNRNMSDSLYVMETSADYFDEEVQQTTQLDKPIDKPEVEEQEQSNINDKLVEQVQNKNDIITESNSEMVSEPKIEVKQETTELILTSEDCVEKVDNHHESNKVAEIAVAAAVGTAAIAAVTGVSLASKKSAPKKTEATVSKTKTTTTKPLASKPLASTLKKTTSSTTTTKPLSRPATATSTSKPTANVRPTTAPKATSLKATTVTKAAPKPAPKTTIPASRPTSAKTTPTTPRTTLTKTTPLSSPKTPTTPKTTTTATKLTGTTPKTNVAPRTSLVNKQPLTNGSPKLLSRPMSAPIKKPLTNITTNGTTKLTNGDVSKTSATSKPPVTLASRMSLAPPKLPPKVKAAPKTVAPPAMPGPIRRPKAPITKKTETATS